MPALARQHTVAGAKAFSRYYWTAANFAQSHMKPKTLLPLSDNECAGCRALYRAIAHFARDHVHVSGGDTSVRALTATPSKAGDGTTWMECELRLHSTPQRIDYPGQPGRHRAFRGGPGRGQMSLRPTPAGWVVDRLDVLQ